MQPRRTKGDQRVPAAVLAAVRCRHVLQGRGEHWLVNAEPLRLGDILGLVPVSLCSPRFHQRSTHRLFSERFCLKTPVRR